MTRELELLNDNHHRFRELRSISRDLRDLGYAFLTTGNRQVGDDLISIAAEISDHTTAISGNISEDLNIQIRNGEATSAAMLASALLGTAPDAGA